MRSPSSILSNISALWRQAFIADRRKKIEAHVVASTRPLPERRTHLSPYCGHGSYPALCGARWGRDHYSFTDILMSMKPDGVLEWKYEDDRFSPEGREGELVCLDCLDIISSPNYRHIKKP